MKHKIILLFLACLFGSMQKSWAATSDTIIYQKPCSDYVRMAVKLGETRWKVIEKKGSILLFEGEYQLSNFTKEALSAGNFYSHFGSQKFIEKYYTIDGKLQLILEVFSIDSFLVRMYENGRNWSEYEFFKTKIWSLDEIFVRRIKEERFFYVMLAKNPQKITKYINGKRFEVYEKQENKNFYLQTIYKDDAVIQKNVFKSYYISFRGERDDLDLKNFIYDLNAVKAFDYAFSNPHIEFYNDYTMKRKISINGHFETRLHFDEHGHIIDSSVYAIVPNPDNYSASKGDTTWVDVPLYNNYVDSTGKVLFLYQVEHNENKTIITWSEEVRDSLIEIRKEISPKQWHDRIGYLLPRVYQYKASPKKVKNEYKTEIFYNGNLLKSYQTVLDFNENYKMVNYFYFLENEAHYTMTFMEEHDELKSGDYIHGEDIWLDSSIIIRNKLTPETLCSVNPIESWDQNVFNANLHDLHASIKKDFELCLYGIWSRTQGKYTAPPEYIEIVGLNPEYPIFFKATKDYKEFLVINGQNEVLFRSNENFRSGKVGEFYYVQMSDGTHVFTPEFKEMHVNETLYDFGTYQNHVIIRDETENQTLVFSVTKDSVIKEVFSNYLFDARLKEGSQNLYLLHDHFTIYTFRNNGIQPIYTTDDTIYTVDKDDLSFMIAINKTNWRFIHFENPYLISYSIETDSQQNLFDEINYRRQKWGSSNNLSYSDNIAVYYNKGKKGCINGKLFPVLLPEWDDIDVGNYVATKEGKSYRFNTSGDRILLPFSRVEIEYKESKIAMFVSDDRKTLDYQGMLYHLVSPIKHAGWFTTSYSEDRYGDVFISVITEDGAIYELNWHSLRKLETPATGIFTHASTDKKTIYLNGEQVGQEYDRVYKVGEIKFLNPLLKSANQLNAVIGNVTYSIDLSDKTIKQTNSAIGREQEINGHIFGYDNQFKLYYNACDKIRYLPDSFQSYQLFELYNSDLVLASTQPKNDGYYNSNYYLTNLITGKTSTYQISGSIFPQDNYLLVRDASSRYHLIDENLNEILPFSAIQKVTFMSDYAFIRTGKQWYRYNLSTKKTDTLNFELKYFDREKYACTTDHEIRVYNYKNELLATSDRYFLDDLTQLESLNISDTFSGLKRYVYSNISHITPLQSSFLKVFHLMTWNIGNDYRGGGQLRLVDFPDKTYHEEKEKYLSKNEEVETDRFVVEEEFGFGERYEMFEEGMIEFEVYSGDSYFSHPFKGYKANFEEQNLEFEKYLTSLDFDYENFYFLPNGLVKVSFSSNYSGGYPHTNCGLYIELRDSGYKLWTFENIFDTTKLTQLTEYLQHQVSLNPSFWGVTCSQDLEKYNLEYFAKKFEINDKFEIQHPDDYKHLGGLRLTYDDLKEYMTPEAKALFESTMK
ncbi:MAG: hypothetical protein H6607_13345 [Flavobacteriales bacterium]|nr:hypothetical protein [Flavobacteriales bacterium]